MKASIAILVILVLCGSARAWAEDDALLGMPPVDGPLEVRIGFNLMNITDVSERQETIDFDGALYLSWRDPRLAYDPIAAGISPERTADGDYEYAPPRIYQGDFEVKELFLAWRPHVVIPNGVGDRVKTNMAVSVWPDGTVEYSETFYAKVEAPMQMRRFPFDRQSLEIFFHPFVYQREELILVPDDHLARTWNKNMGIAEWTRGPVSIAEQPVEIAYFDDSMVTISEFVVTVHVERQPTHVLVSIILPMVILVSLSWCVFWMDEEALADRVNISFIGILSVVAYYFVIQDSVPKISYLTLIDGFIITTFVILALSVVISIAVDKLNKAGRGAAGDRLDRTCRWAFPLGYVVVSLLVGVIFFNLG
jgi:hypothetical protein